MEMEQLREAFLTFGVAAGVLLFTVFVYAIAGVLLTWANTYKLKLVVLDDRLTPFGQTLVGQRVHQLITDFQPLVDSPDDKLVIQALAMVNKILPQTSDKLTSAQVAEAFSMVVMGLAQLTDGMSELEKQKAASKAEG